LGGQLVKITSIGTVDDDSFYLEILGDAGNYSPLLYVHGAQYGVQGQGSANGVAGYSESIPLWAINTATGRNNIVDGVVINRSTPLALTGMGVQIHTNLSDSAGGTDTASLLITKWTTPTAGNETAQWEVWLKTGGATETRKLAVAGTGQLILDKYGINTFAGVPTYALGTDASGNIVEFAVGGGAVAGADKQVQYNDAGSFGAEAGFEYDKTTNELTVPHIIDSGLTASEIVGTNGSKKIISLAVATYPSLTELAFVKGVTSAIQTQIDAIASTSIEDVVIKAYASLGSTIKAQAVGQTIARITGTGVLTNQLISFIGVYLNTSQTLTGVKWWQGTLGNYTANNENRVGLYSYSGGTLTLVASSTNDGTLWSTSASSTLGSKAFSSTYGASAGLYFVAILYCRSAVVTAPAIGICPNITNATIQALDFTNSAKIWAYKTGVTSLPATQAMSGLTADVGNFWISIY